MLLFNKLLLEHLVDHMWDLLAASDREDVLSENLETLIQHIQGQSVQKGDLLLGVRDQL